MDEDEGGGGALKKKKLGTGEVDFKEKAGTAWSHNFLNQKPWHPLSYPNQRRKWIAEQTDAQKQRRAEEVAREFAQEQEFFRQSALISKKEKEKVEVMKAVSFMYVRPPGYNAESAKAAELEDERRRSEGSFPPQPSNDAVSVPSSMPPEDKKKLRPKDVFGRTLPTEEEFEVLKNAPRMETGLPARVKPFGIEVRNVKCLRCGNYGHQSGDRECPLRDAIMPNEENRLKRDDPLTSIMAHTDTSEPLKWELKQKPGMSPPRGGFKPDDPNQQIVAEDIFDEYGGFLSGGSIPDLLTNFSVKKSKKHSKHKTKPEGQSSAARNDSKVQRTRLSPSYTDSDREKRSKKKMLKEKHKRRGHSASSDSSDTRRHNRRKENKLSLPSSPDDDSGAERCRGKNRHRRVILPDNSHHDKEDTHFKSSRYKHSISHDDPYYDKHRKRNKRQRSFSSDDSESDSSDSEIHMHNGNEHRHSFSSSSDDDSEMDRHFERNKHRRAVLQDSPRDRHHKRNKHRLPISSDHAEDGRHCQRSRKNHSVSPDDSYYGRRHKKDRRQRSFSPDCSDSDRYRKRSKHDNDPYYEKDRKRDKHQLSASSDDAEYSRHHERHKHRRRHHGDHHRSHKSD